jgi:hypothetical protein
MTIGKSRKSRCEWNEMGHINIWRKLMWIYWEITYIQILWRVSQLRYLGATVTNRNLIQEEIRRRLTSGNACYHSMQDLLSSCLQSTCKIRTYKTINLSVVLYGCEPSSLTLWGTQTEGIWGQGAEEDIWTDESWSDRRLENMHNEELVTFTLLQVYSELSQGRWDGQGM